MRHIPLALLLFACSIEDFPAPVYANPPGFTSATIEKRVCIDPWFDQEDRDEIELAVDMWSVALNGAAAFTPAIGVINCDWKILHAEHNDPILTQKMFLRDGVEIIDHALINAYTNHLGGDEIRVVRHHIHTEEKLRLVVLHEIGHLLGSDHNRSGLMMELYSAREYQCIDQLTMINVCKYQGLDYNFTNPCVIPTHK